MKGKAKMRNCFIWNGFFKKGIFVESCSETEKVTINEHREELSNQSIMPSKSER